MGLGHLLPSMAPIRIFSGSWTPPARMREALGSCWRNLHLTRCVSRQASPPTPQGSFISWWCQFVLPRSPQRAGRSVLTVHACAMLTPGFCLSVIVVFRKRYQNLLYYLLFYSCVLVGNLNVPVRNKLFSLHLRQCKVRKELHCPALPRMQAAFCWCSFLGSRKLNRSTLEENRAFPLLSHADATHLEKQNFPYY